MGTYVNSQTLQGSRFELSNVTHWANMRSNFLRIRQKMTIGF